MPKHLAEIVGWYGTAAIIGAYAMVSFGLLGPSDLSYQLLNATGAVGVAVVSFHKKAWQPGVLNVVWTAIALVAIGRLLI